MFLISITSKLWWHAPVFVQTKEDNWPQQPDLTGNPPEKRSSVPKTISIATKAKNIERFARLSKLLRVVVYVLKAIKCFKKQQFAATILAEELGQTRMILVKQEQRKHLGSAFEQLCNGGNLSKQQLFNLTPFFDLDCEVIRVGEVSQSNLPMHFKFPTIVPGRTAHNECKSTEVLDSRREKFDKKCHQKLCSMQPFQYESAISTHGRSSHGTNYTNKYFP